MLLSQSAFTRTVSATAAYPGLRFYYPDSDEGRKAADAIQEELNDMQPDNRKEVKANDTYYILKNTEIPVVIVECGFLSNYTEAEKLADDSYQSVVAGTVVRGILQYIND